EFVLGHHSTAHILLDNEDASAEHSQSARLLAGIKEINELYRDVPGYVPLRVETAAPAVRTAVGDGGRLEEFTELGGVELRIRHQPPYRVVTVTRGHDLPGPGTEPAPAATDTAGENSQVPAFPGANAAWNSPDSDGGESGPVLAAFDESGEGREVTWAEVTSSAWFAELHPAHRERLRGVGEFTLLEDALEETRNTVVAAVDGGAGPEDVALLADLHGLRDNVSVYDPAMMPHMPRFMERELGAGRAVLVQGSVTRFGHHVPYTDLVVPHPGPWAQMPNQLEGLAYSLEYVLGHHSTAHILLDNEDLPVETRQSALLLAGIEEINELYRDVPGYVPLRVELSTPAVRARVSDNGRLEEFTELGGVELRVRHRLPVTVVTVTRGHELPLTGTTPAPTTTDTSPAPAFPGANAAWNSPGSDGGGSGPVLVAFDESGEGREVTWAEV
ncbi:hypothetical protein CUT44_08670, partial [Streptomyces carminius]